MMLLQVISLTDKNVLSRIHMKILLQTAKTQVSLEEEEEEKFVYNWMTKYLLEMLLIAGWMLLIRK